MEDRPKGPFSILLFVLGGWLCLTTKRMHNIKSSKGIPGGVCSLGKDGEDDGAVLLLHQDRPPPETTLDHPFRSMSGPSPTSLLPEGKSRGSAYTRRMFRCRVDEGSTVYPLPVHLRTPRVPSWTCLKVVKEVNGVSYGFCSCPYWFGSVYCQRLERTERRSRLLRLGDGAECRSAVRLEGLGRGCSRRRAGRS